MQTVISSGTSGATIVAAAPGYAAIQHGGGSTGTFGGTQVNRRNVMPMAGTLSNFRIISGAPGGATTVTYTVQKNSVDTAMSIVITGAGTTGSDLVNTVSFVAGDVLQIKAVASAGAATVNVARWTFALTGTTAGQSCILAHGPQTLGTGSNSYLGIQHQTTQTLQTTAPPVETIVPTDGTLRNFYVQLTGTAGAAKSYTFNLYKNGVATAVSIVVSGAVATTGNDTSTTVSATAGDRFYWECVPSGTPTGRLVTLGIEFDPTVDGESVQCYVAAPSLDTANVRYYQGDAVAATTAAVRQAMLSACVVRKLYTYLSAATGAAKSVQTQVEINGSVTSMPSVTITNAQSGSDTSTSYTASDTDLVTIKVTPTGTPAAAQLEAGFVTFVDPVTFIPQVIMM